MPKPAIVVVDDSPVVLHQLKHDLQRKYSDRFRILEVTSCQRICQNSGHGEKCPQKVGNASCKTSSWWGKHKYMSAVLEEKWGNLSSIL